MGIRAAFFVDCRMDACPKWRLAVTEHRRIERALEG
jgi:hypothetical protein